MSPSGHHRNLRKFWSTFLTFTWKNICSTSAIKAYFSYRNLVRASTKLLVTSGLWRNSYSRSVLRMSPSNRKPLELSLVYAGDRFQGIVLPEVDLRLSRLVIPKVWINHLSWHGSAYRNCIARLLENIPGVATMGGREGGLMGWRCCQHDSTRIERLVSEYVHTCVYWAPQLDQLRKIGTADVNLSIP